MTRVCGRCGSASLGMVEHGSGLYLRKECLECGSTGPFVLSSDDHMDPDIAPPHADEPGALGLPSRRQYREQADRLFRQLREGS